MPAVATRNLIDGFQCVEDTTGIKLVWPYHVTGITAGSSVWQQALNASGMPQYGDPDTDDSSIYCVRREPKPFAKNSRTEMIVAVTYSPPDWSNPVGLDGVVRFAGTVRGVETNFDFDGKPITVPNPFADTIDPDGSDNIIGRVSGSKAFGILTHDLIAYENPRWRLQYLNCLNSVPFWGVGRYCWWVRDVQIEKQLFRAGWRVHVEIELDGENYLKTAVWRDIDGNVPKAVNNGSPLPLPKTISFGRGYRTVRVNGLADLNGLNIPGVL